MKTPALIMATCLLWGIQQSHAGDWHMAPLTEPELDQLRGGFISDGVVISIGLEQIISVDGETQVVNHLNIPELGQSGINLTQWTQGTTGNLAGTVMDGTRIAGKLSDGAILTLIQNSLDGKLIQNFKALNIELHQFGRLRPTSDQYSNILPLIGR
ncbi:hypothetical protein QQM79_09465 [Marinobacteraceae bacterium S3BR75-40.1]